MNHPSTNTAYAALHALAFQQKNPLPRMATSSFTRAAFAVSSLPMWATGGRLPTDPNQQNNVLLSQERTLMTKSPA